jgi:imidazolonepropionase-like amidohydrolase
LQRWEPELKGKTFPSGLFNNSVQLLSFLHKQGVMILAGTDCENPYIVLGPSLHEELEWYVKGGLTPLEALQTATLNPAIFLHKEKQLGTVEKDKLADLVILDQNPLAGIKNTRTIML